ncbi:MAG: short-chain dehydrogenase [Halioglobus sp.]|nr:short-chain dehydrogenase [Halioglobus sp.]|tara:strand:- start:3854 stop:4603 length:750 start_codon:yes stop_codon:yes gene_type:complete
MFQGITYNFSGARVLVTGGTSGIGLGCAQAFRDAGAQVLITGRAAGVDSYEGDFDGLAYRQVDVAERAQLRALAASLDGLDILVNSAGGMQDDEWGHDGFDRSIAVNLSSVFHLSTACKDLLAASDFPGGASVIGIASMTSYFGFEWTPGYGPAKAGLVQVIKTLGMSWGPLGIRANAVAAGLTRSNLTAFTLDHMEEMVADTLKRQGIKRTGVPADIAAAVLFLCSPAASWITGQTLPVDGGFNTGMS